MQGKLRELYVLSTGTDWFPLDLDSWLRDSIIIISQRMNSIPSTGGVIEGGTIRTLKQETIFRGKEYRIEIENLRGHNLRFLGP